MIYRNSLCSLVLCINFTSPMALTNNEPTITLTQGQIFVPTQLGKITVSHDPEGFYIHNEHGSQRIQRCFIDKELRNISTENLTKFLDNGYLSVDRMSDGEYSLKAHGRLNGGGPILGKTLGWGIRGIMYGGIALATTFFAIDGVRNAHYARVNADDEDDLVRDARDRAAVCGTVLGRLAENGQHSIRGIEELASFAERLGNMAPTP